MINAIEIYNRYKNDDTLKIKDAIRFTKNTTVCIIYRVSCKKDPRRIMLRIKKFFRSKFNIEVFSTTNTLPSKYYLENEYYKIGVVIKLYDSTAVSCMLYDYIEDYTFEGKPFDVLINIRNDTYRLD